MKKKENIGTKGAVHQIKSISNSDAVYKKYTE